MSARKRKDGRPNEKRVGMTKSQKVLLFIAESPDGRFNWELEKFVSEMLGHDWNETMTVYRWRRNKNGESVQREYVVQRWRGTWSNNFPRLLEKFCAKNPETGKWVPNFLVGENQEVVSLDGRYIYKGGPCIDLQKGNPR